MLTFPPAMQFNGQCSAAADVVDIGFSNTVVASRVSSLHDAAIIVTFSSALLLQYLRRLPSSRIQPLAQFGQWHGRTSAQPTITSAPTAYVPCSSGKHSLHVTSELRQAVHKNLHGQQHIVLEPNWDPID